MQRVWILVLLVACSGDDAHRQTTLHPKVPTPPATGSGDAAAAAPVTPPVAPATGAVAPLSESMATPYFTTGDAQVGATAFAAQQWKEARAAFELARKTATGEDAARVDLMLGLCNAEFGYWARAAELLLAARNGLPLLADYLGYHAARALYFAKQLTEALAVAKSVTGDSIVGPEAELLVGDVLRGSADAATIAAHYRDYLTRRPNGMRRGQRSRPPRSPRRASRSRTRRPSTSRAACSCSTACATRSPKQRFPRRSPIRRSA